MLIEDIVYNKNITFEHDSYLYEVVKLIERSRNISVASFADAMRSGGLKIVGELREVSPEMNMSNKYFDVYAMAEDFDKCADGISVVTESHRYNGKDLYIKQVREKTNLPVVKRDIIISPMEIFYAKTLGASAVTLVSAILDDVELREYINIINGLKMDAIVEVQTKGELIRALKAGAKIILMNTLDYESLQYNPDILSELAPIIPKNIISIADCVEYGDKELKLIVELNINVIFLTTDIFNVSDRVKRVNELRDKYLKRIPA